MTNKDSLISVVVVNWNGARFLRECLESLAAQTWPHRELIVVDNGSTDGSERLVREWCDSGRARALMLGENTGFTRANNLAFREARGEWIALLNNDAVAAPDWLEQLVRRGDLDNKIGMLGGKILFAWDKTLIDKAGHLIYRDGLNRGRGTGQKDEGQFETEEEILWPDGCAALYHRQLLADTGGFDDDFFAYGDDADLGIRARLLGWRAWYAPQAVVYHHHSGTAGAYSPLKAMLVERNRLFLALKNFPLGVLLQNPFWALRRYAWQAYGALAATGSSGCFVREHGRWRLVKTLGWAYLSAAKQLFPILAKRRKIQKNRQLSAGEVKALLRRYEITVRELTLQE